MEDEEGVMVDPATAPWGVSISDADFEKLKVGFEPRDMDDKWLIQIADPDPSGIVSINICRGWIGRKYSILHIRPSDASSGVKIESITWEQNNGGYRVSEEQGKKEAVILCRAILECDFDKLPHYEVSDLWNYPPAVVDPTGVN
jgi:hypothetical protein